MAYFNLLGHEDWYCGVGVSFSKDGVGTLWLEFLMLLIIALVGRDKESKSDPNNDVELKVGTSLAIILRE